MSLVSGDDTGLVKHVLLKSKRLLTTSGAQSRARAVCVLAWVPHAAGAAASSAHVAALGRDGTLVVYDTATGATVHTCLHAGADAVLLCALRGDFIVVTRAGLVRVFSQGAADAGAAREFSVGAPVAAAAYHADAGVLAVGGRENELAVWRVDTGERVWAARAVAPDKLDLRVPVWVSAIVFLGVEEVVAAPAEVGAASAAVDGEAGGRRRKRPAAAAPPPDAAVEPAPPAGGDVQLSPFRIAIATGFRDLRYYDTRVSRRPISSVAAVGDFPFTALALSRDGKSLVTGDASGIMRKFDARTFSACGVFRGHTGAIKSLAVHGAHPYVASASLDRTVRVFNVDSGQLLRRFYLKQRLAAVLFAPASQSTLAIVNPEGAPRGAGVAVRYQSAVDALTRAPEEEDAIAPVGKAAGGDSSADEDDVWRELDRRAELAKGAGGAAAAKKRRT